MSLFHFLTERCGLIQIAYCIDFTQLKNECIGG
jgi:hypothetical protein